MYRGILFFPFSNCGYRYCIFIPPLFNRKIAREEICFKKAVASVGLWRKWIFGCTGGWGTYASLLGCNWKGAWLGGCFFTNDPSLKSNRPADRHEGWENIKVRMIHTHNSFADIAHGCETSSFSGKKKDKKNLCMCVKIVHTTIAIVWPFLIQLFWRDVIETFWIKRECNLPMKVAPHHQI